MSRQYEDAQERQQHEKIAAELGITHEELDQCQFELSERSSDDGLVYSLLVEFSDQSPKHVLKKIKGLDDNLTAELDAGLFDEPEE